MHNPIENEQCKWTFLKRRHTKDQQVYEKMLNITNYQGNANQNDNEIEKGTIVVLEAWLKW
jgi:hypothetical protein